MCIAQQQLNPKARRLLQMGSACLVAGLLRGLFSQQFGARNQNLVDGLRGFFLGLAICLLLGNAWMRRRRA